MAPFAPVRVDVTSDRLIELGKTGLPFHELRLAMGGWIQRHPNPIELRDSFKRLPNAGGPVFWLDVRALL